MRPHWQRFAGAAAHLSGEEFGRRWLQAQRLLRQNSLAYPDPNDPHARRHPWALDAYPLVITSTEWRKVSAALVQRAHLLDLVLRDLYGPQTLLQEGVIPPEVVFRHPGFLLPYRHRQTEPQRQLHLYAADLARSPDGRWWVMNDRTESPSGAGFALENRIALSRMLPDVIHQCRVERYAPFFIALQRQLASLSPQQCEQPRVVLLSRAAGSANYFEDAFLARYLGYTLAEASDLDVRDNRVHLRTLAGLTRVDVLWRRPNSDECDPLELSSSSSVGVAGLLQATRRGNVAIANPLGSGLVESPVFMAFMPQLCQKLLGEPLKMPGVATWWCGDQKMHPYILEHLDQLVIEPAYRRRGFGYAEFQHLADLGSRQLAELIEADPGSYVAREAVQRSTAPVWSDPRSERAYVALRAFAVADGDCYLTMPGGLTRLSAELKSLELSLLDGEGSKDTWVLADGPVAPVTLLQTSDEAVELRRGGVDLPSRAAEHFFWLGRLSTRAEALGKLLRAVASRLTSEETAHNIPELHTLLRVLAYQGQIEPGLVVEEIRTQMPAIEQLLAASVFESDDPGSLRMIVSRIAMLASTVRDLMSLDNWRIIRQMDDNFWRSPDSEGLLDVLEKIDALLVQLAAFGGHVAGSMTRTHAWRFLDLGRCLEHALQTSILVHNTLGTSGAADEEVLRALLEISDAVMTYRSRYFSRMSLAPVLDLLLTDETNPRSALFQVIQCAKHVEQLPGERDGPESHPDHVLATSLLNVLRSADMQQISRTYAAGDSAALHRLLGAIEETLPKLSDAIAHQYFFHSGPTVQLAGIQPA
jgi:uncharacterized circularly permuted ATP-grasp superfamily protein/uncharacterized alpha-E superfamily protein